MDTEPFNRVEVYNPVADETEITRRFKFEWGNESFRRSLLTWLTLTFLILLYPLSSILTAEDPSKMLTGLNDTTRLILFISTMVIQWLLFLLILGTTYRENTGLAGLGFKRLRAIDLFWAFSFLGASFLILSGLAILLEKIGLPMSGDISLLIPEDTTGRIVWVFLSLTAGICEETAFRGYLMTRLRLVGNLQNWLIPILISSIAFGSAHAYQGWPGFILISVYGAMFSILFIYTRTIWPAIIAHFFQDFMALFVPQ